MVQTANNILICDYYNANPTSMAAAITNMGELTAAHKTLILGEMFELGTEAEAEHKAIVEKALATSVDRRIIIGKEFYKLKDDALPVEFYETRDEAAAALQAEPVKGSTILIKGSRGMALEKLLELF